MSRFMRLIVIVSMAAAAASCAADGTTVLPLYVGSYDPGMLNYAASKGGMLTEIVGNPFDVPKEEVGRAVTNNMTGSHFGPKVVFTTKASPDNPSPYRVVVLFDPAPNAQAQRLCSDPNQPSAGGSAEAHGRLLQLGHGHHLDRGLDFQAAAADAPDLQEPDPPDCYCPVPTPGSQPGLLFDYHCL